MATSEEFGVGISNIPIWNLRWEFLYWLDVLETPDFRAQFSGRLAPIQSRYLVWLGMPNDFLTLILIRSVTGLESYISGAAHFELGCRGRLGGEVSKWVRNPHLLGTNGTADCYFNKLPEKLDPSCQLRLQNQKLWSRTKAFYREVRNPLFHGGQLEASNYENVVAIFRYLESLYDWVHTWHDPEAVERAINKKNDKKANGGEGV
jgi:hypothetical protein